MNRKVLGIFGIVVWVAIPACSAFVRSTRLSETLDSRFSSMFSTMQIPLTAGVVVPREVKRHVLSTQARLQGNEADQKKAPRYDYAVGRAIAAMMLPATRIAFDFATEVKDIEEARRKKLDGIITVKIIKNSLDVTFLYRKGRGEGTPQAPELATIKGETLLEVEATFFDLGHRPIWRKRITSKAFDTFGPESAEDAHLFDPIVEESVQHAIEEMVLGLKAAPELFNFSGTPRY